jgi:hypothetical protein
MNTKGAVGAVATGACLAGIAAGQWWLSRRGEASVNKRVRVYPDTETEVRGVIVEDFGDYAGQGVDIGTQHVADPARRWAVRLDDEELVFVDSDDIVVDH